MLTRAQLDALLDQARAGGMQPAQVDGIELFLLARAAQLSGSGKLALGARLAPAAKRKADAIFRAEMEAQRKTGLQRAADDILGMSESEWSALFTDEGKPDATAE